MSLIFYVSATFSSLVKEETLTSTGAISFLMLKAVARSNKIENSAGVIFVKSLS